MTTFDRWRYFDIGLSNHEIWNPTSAAKLARVAELLRISPSGRVLDAGCGRAELSIHLIEKYGCSVVAIDKSPLAIPRARENAAQRVSMSSLALIEADAADFDGEAASFDVAMCVGASWIWGGYRNTLRALMDYARPGGLVLSGEPFFQRDPATAYLAAEGFERDEFDTHAGNFQTGIDLGLQPLYTSVSNRDDWDHYESLQWYSIESWAEANPDDPDCDAIVAESRKYRDNYLNWGRDTLGWALYLFRKPSNT